MARKMMSLTAARRAYKTNDNRFAKEYDDDRRLGPNQQLTLTFLFLQALHPVRVFLCGRLLVIALSFVQLCEALGSVLGGRTRQGTTGIMLN